MPGRVSGPRVGTGARLPRLAARRAGALHHGGDPDAGPRHWPPTLAEEDSRRPGRERETLVGERTRIVNRMKGALARLGIRGFKATLRKAPEHNEVDRLEARAAGH